MGREYHTLDRSALDRSALVSSSTAMDIASLTQVVSANRAGRAIGVYAVCSAHPVVVEAAGGRDDEPDKTSSVPVADQ